MKKVYNKCIVVYYFFYTGWETHVWYILVWRYHISSYSMTIFKALAYYIVTNIFNCIIYLNSKITRFYWITLRHVSVIYGHYNKYNKIVKMNIFDNSTYMKYIIKQFTFLTKIVKRYSGTLQKDNNAIIFTKFGYCT